LVCVDLDAGAKGRLKEARIRRCDAVPAKRVKKCCKVSRRIETLRSQVAPPLSLEDQSIDLVVPEDIERLPLVVVVCAGEADKC
jgi:hypothetical protein